MSAKKDKQKRHYGNKLGMSIFYGAIRVFGVLPAYFMLLLLIPYYIILRPVVVKNSAPYLRHRFPEDSSFRRYFRTWKYIYRFGLNLIDQTALGILGPAKFKVSFPDEQYLIDMAEENKPGFVMINSHVGSWEASMAYVKKMETPVNFIMEVDNPDRTDDHFFDHMGERKGFKFINPHEYMGGMLSAVKALEDKEIVAVMGDRREKWKTFSTPFLGEEALFPVIGQHLASSTETDLLIILTARTNRLSFTTRIINLTERLTEAEKTGPKKARLMRYLELYSQALEQHLETYPYAWFNFFDFWEKDADE